MADEAQTPEIDDTQQLAPEAEQEAPVSEEGEEEELLVFGDLPEEQAETDKLNDNGVIRHLREELRKARKQAAEAAKPKAEEVAVDPGPRPKLEDFDYDEDKHADAIEEWAEKKQAAKAKANQSNTAQEAQIEATRQRIEAEKAALNRADADEAFELVRDTLSEAQQSALVATVDDGNTAKLIYALANNPDKLTAIAGEQNLARFIKEVGKLEGQLKMVKRRTRAAEPDTPEKGSGSPATNKNAAQKQLEKMEAEWKGGDRSHIQKFKREHGLK